MEKIQVVSVMDMMPVERERKVEIYYKKENSKKIWLILESEERIKTWPYADYIASKDAIRCHSFVQILLQRVVINI